MNKKKLITGIIIALIVLPIISNKVMTFVSSKIMAKMNAKPPAVEVGTVVKGDYYPKTESVGRIEAKYSVDVVARINGWLQKSYFKEGNYVKKGQTLFLIQPHEYEIAVQQAQAAVRQSEAALVNAEKELTRARELVKNDFVSKSYFDQALATRDQNKAQLDANKASLANAKLNLSYTRIKAPVDGKIGKIIITEGNLVNAQSGTLARIVSTSPIYVYFNLKSEDYLKFKKAEAEAQDDLGDTKVFIKLSDGSIYHEEGVLEFVNNEVDPTAGTISLRATFDNKDRFLVPGDFVNVVAEATKPKQVLLVPQIAVSESTQGTYVWVVDKNNEEKQKFIKISNQEGDKWIVKEGLSEGETVITKGFQTLRDGITVAPEPPALDNAQKGTDENAEQSK